LKDQTVARSFAYVIGTGWPLRQGGSNDACIFGVTKRLGRKIRRLKRFRQVAVARAAVRLPAANRNVAVLALFVT